MKAFGTRIAAVALALVLAVGLPAAAGAVQAATGADPAPDVQATAAADWLLAHTPQPGALDAAAALALLRGGHLAAADGWTQDFLQAMKTHLNAGEAQGQPAADSAAQALAMTAAGEKPGSALMNALSNAAAAGGAGYDEKRLALLVYTAAGQSVPGALGGAEGLAEELAALQNADGGYGPGGVSNPKATAGVLQALAPYTGQAPVQAAVDAALAWLREHAAAYGGFTLNGAPSAAATAEVEIALACLGLESLGDGLPAPGELVRGFQGEDGAFYADPDAEADAGLTAVCLLAMTARARQQAGLAVYGPDAAANLPGVGGMGWLDELQLPSIGPVSTPVMLAILGGVVVLVVVLAIPSARRQRRKNRQRLRLEAAGHSEDGNDAGNGARTYRAGSKKAK